MPPVIIHHLEKSRATRIVWLLEELDVSYELREYKRQPDLRAPPELKKIHPLGKSPVVEIEGRRLAESGAILEHLLDRYDGEGRFRPAPGSEALDDFRYWLHYAEGSLMTPLFVRLLFSRLRAAPVPFFVKPIIKGIVAKVDETYTAPEIDRHFAFINDTLSQRDYFAGEFSAADIQMSYGIDAAANRMGLDGRPAIAAWQERVHSRPAYQEAAKHIGGTL